MAALGAASLSASFFQQHFSPLESLCHILAIFTILQTFSLLLYLLRWSLISDLRRYYCNCLGHHKPRPWKKANVTERWCVYALWLHHWLAFLVSLPLLRQPYSLKHNNIEIRPINNHKTACLCSSESLASLTLNQKLEMSELEETVAYQDRPEARPLAPSSHIVNANDNFWRTLKVYSGEYTNDKKVKQPYCWYGESFSGLLDRGSNRTIT